MVLLPLVHIMGANHEHSASLLFLSSAKAGAVAPVTCGGCMGILGNVCAFSLVTSFHASNVKPGSTASRLGRSKCGPSSFGCSECRMSTSLPNDYRIPSTRWQICKASTRKVPAQYPPHLMRVLRHRWSRLFLWCSQQSCSALGNIGSCTSLACPSAKSVDVYCTRFVVILTLCCVEDAKPEVRQEGPWIYLIWENVRTYHCTKPIVTGTHGDSLPIS